MSQSRSVVILCQETAKEWLNAEDIEKVAGYHSYPDQLTVVITDQACILNYLAGKARQNGVPIAQREIGGMGESVSAVAAVRAESPALDPELDEFPRVLHRQQAQRDLVEEGEDRSIRPDAKCE